MGWMGPVVGDVQHEGWVVPLFADGAEGAGTSGSQGVLVARRPGEPSNGDRVRLTYGDGSVVEGIWQDDVVLRDDGGVHTHTRGQVRREVLEEAEEWRPDAAVVGWVAGCECGWRGRPWTRVNSPAAAGAGEGHPPKRLVPDTACAACGHDLISHGTADTHCTMCGPGAGHPIGPVRCIAFQPVGTPATEVETSVADQANRLIFQPGPFYFLDDDAERLVIDEWREHIAPFRTIEAIEEAAARYAATGRELDEAVRAARAAGASWTDVGRAAGMSRQSAHVRWRDLATQPPEVGARWDVEVRWDGESHTAERPFAVLTDAQTWCSDKVIELFRDGIADERASAAALVARIRSITGESRGYQLVDDDLGVEVYLSADGDVRGLSPVGL